MATVLLLGSRSSTLDVVSDLLDTLGHRVLCADVPGHHERFVKLALAVIEYSPQDVPLAEFINRVRLLKPLQTLVISPDLPQDQLAQLLGPEHVTHCLRTTASAHEKRTALRAWLPETGPAVLTLGPLHLNMQDHTVHHGVHPMMFTPTEVQLLGALMQRPGQRTDCATLGALVTCRNVQTHLGNMRRKLNMCSEVPLLRGNPGQGYTLDARRYTRHSANPGAALRTHLNSLM